MDRVWGRLGGAAVAAAAALAGPALASCPAGAEAGRAGVTVRMDDGSVSHYAVDADGMVTEEALFDDPDIDGYRVHALYGLFVVDEYDLVDGAPEPSTRERQSFSLGLKGLPAPAPGLVWQGNTVVTVGDEPTFRREVSVALGLPETVDYGGCVYDSWPATVRHRDDSDDYVLSFDYLPDLQIAVFRAYADFGGEVDRYTPLSIEARPR